MASHPYISGPGNIAQMIGHLKKNFPSTITSETVKKFGLASNNESYVINALNSIGIIDSEGKRTDKGLSVFTLHDEQKFQQAFSDLVKDAYKDLFELRGEDAWALPKGDLVGYFRTTDKTSDVIGSRQASVFQVFCGLAGHGVGEAGEKPPRPKRVLKVTGQAPKPKKGSDTADPPAPADKVAPPDPRTAERDMALTVRVEINLPAGGSQETYDAIFRSIKANLLGS